MRFHLRPAVYLVWAVLTCCPVSVYADAPPVPEEADTPFGSCPESP